MCPCSPACPPIWTPSSMRALPAMPDLRRKKAQAPNAHVVRNLHTGCRFWCRRRSRCHQCCRGRRSCSHRFPRRRAITQRPTCGMRCGPRCRGNQPNPSRPNCAPACTTTRSPTSTRGYNTESACRCTSATERRCPSPMTHVAADPTAITNHDAVPDNGKRLHAYVRTNARPWRDDCGRMHAHGPCGPGDESEAGCATMASTGLSTNDACSRRARGIAKAPVPTARRRRASRQTSGHTGHWPGSSVRRLVGTIQRGHPTNRYRAVAYQFALRPAPQRRRR